MTRIQGQEVCTVLYMSSVITFITNSINCLLLQAMFLLEEGASVEQVDRVLEEFGFPIGKFKVMDLSGKQYVFHEDRLI